MNYIGSKNSLINFLDSTISEITNLTSGVFCDLFAGTGVVGLRFKQKGFKVISNDLQYYSYVINKHLIENCKPLNFSELQNDLPQLKNCSIDKKPNVICEYLNKITTIEGFIYKNYSLGGTKGQEFERLYFTDENAKKCDTIRIKIEEWKKYNKISSNEYWFLLASLIESIDKVANTASVYGAFLKKFKKTAQTLFLLNPLPLYESEVCNNVYNNDANYLVKNIKADIVYIDPPYNQRQYSSNYHILETIALYDQPKIFGKTGLRKDASKISYYCYKRHVKEEFSNLIQNIEAKFIFVSYNNDGLLTPREIQDILSVRGEYNVVKKMYKRFQADSNNKRKINVDNTTEYLHYIKLYS